MFVLVVVAFMKAMMSAMKIILIVLVSLLLFHLVPPLYVFISLLINGFCMFVSLFFHS